MNFNTFSIYILTKLLYCLWGVDIELILMRSENCVLRKFLIYRSLQRFRGEVRSQLHKLGTERERLGAELHGLGAKLDKLGAELHKL